MALATTCPQCQTSFKVVPDQLKLRKGLVRCGVCQHVFSGIDNLRYVSEPRSAAPRPAAAPAGADGPDLKTAFFLPETVIGDQRADARRDGPGASPRRPEPPPRREPERLFGDAAPAGASEPPDTAGDTSRPAQHDPGEEHRRDHEHGVDRENRRRRRSDRNDSRKGDAANAAPAGRPGEPDEALGGAFAPVRQQTSSRASQRRLAIAVGVLAVLLVLQLALGSRDLLAARVPAIRPLLSTLGAPLGLQVELPRLPGKLTIESFELAGSGSPGVYKLNALLRNRASHPVQWPAIELSLTDAFGGVIASRVLLPDEYHAGETDAGFPGNSEESVALDIAIDEVVPSGYRAILFYP